MLIYFLQVSLEKKEKRREVTVTVMRTGVKTKKLQEAQQRRVVVAKAREVVTHALSHCLQNSLRLLAQNKWLDTKS